MTMLAELVEVVIGVDTHKDTHTAAAVQTSNGAVLGHTTITSDPAGFAELRAWAADLGGPRAWAIEGAGSYGAGLTEYLTGHDQVVVEVVVEVDRPARPTRRAGAKTDVIDAERAARDALARTHMTQPKTGPQRAALQMHLTARRSAVEATTEAQNQFHALVITAPEQVRARFRGRTTNAMIEIAHRLRPGATHATTDVTAALSVLQALARRIRHLRGEAATHEQAIHTLVQSWRPDLLQVKGVGPIVAATVLTAWSHPGRCRNDAAFAMLAGTAPIPASSGKTVRHRLNRSGDRQLNRAIHTIALTRLRWDTPTRDYVERRRAQGKTDREIKRCLKRYIARQLYKLLENQPLTA